jgi:hypothetical protein
MQTAAPIADTTGSALGWRRSDALNYNIALCPF